MQYIVILIAFLIILFCVIDFLKKLGDTVDVREALEQDLEILDEEVEESLDAIEVNALRESQEFSVKLGEMTSQEQADRVREILGGKR